MARRNVPVVVFVAVVLNVLCIYIGIHIGRSETVMYKDVVADSNNHDALEKGTFFINTMLNVKAMLKHKTENTSFLSDIHKTKELINVAGITSRDTTLTANEIERVQQCVATAKEDLAHSHDVFWDNQYIRLKNHTYLKKNDAVLIEVGGNQGDDASQYVKLFNPRFIILEPIEKYAAILRNKFKENPRVSVLNHGLGAKTEVVMVKLEGTVAEATSKFSAATGETPLPIINATEFLLKLGIGLFDVDLLTLNCEGCEFEVLEMILSTTLVNHFRNIQFGSHITYPVPEAIRRYCRIQELLSKSHRPIYQYKALWESWRRRDLP